jgi:hypothetical protein
VPEEWLEADIKQGISNQDVENRRKRFGWNEIVTEKENLFIKFLMFFTGPILYGKHAPIPTPPRAVTRLHTFSRAQWLAARRRCFFAELPSSSGASCAGAISPRRPASCRVPHAR